MKRLSLKDVNVLLKVHNNYCIRVNEATRQIHIVKFDLGFRCCLTFLITAALIRFGLSKLFLRNDMGIFTLRLIGVVAV